MLWSDNRFAQFWWNNSMCTSCMEWVYVRTCINGIYILFKSMPLKGDSSGSSKMRRTSENTGHIHNYWICSACWDLILNRPKSRAKFSVTSQAQNQACSATAAEIFEQALLEQKKKSGRPSVWGGIFKLTPRSQEEVLFQFRKGKMKASVQCASVWVTSQGVSPHSDYSRDLQILRVKVCI